MNDFYSFTLNGIEVLYGIDDDGLYVISFIENGEETLVCDWECTEDELCIIESMIELAVLKPTIH